MLKLQHILRNTRMHYIISIMSEFIIPDKCDGCSRQCDIETEVMRLDGTITETRARAAAMLSKRFEVYIIDNIEGTPDDELVQDVASQLRAAVNNDLEELEANAKAQRIMSAELAATCSGPIGDAADIASGTALCTSPLAYVAGE